MQVQEQGQGHQRFQTSEMRKRSVSTCPKKEENPITDSLTRRSLQGSNLYFSGLLGRRLAVVPESGQQESAAIDVGAMIIAQGRRL